ncbi:Chromosomal replication initiator protein [Desulfonema limicola]|uniref:Chromosomal replication initiator protein DnaA n=1 Tax=Desulfonema limicola TaxID=45656 RepID=A0A975B7L9_9BACT|nr:chromosomal replication initiator protein DnaA [Desulfonema limicola]QTA80356.1 Chromosomal replication initiator protein [Desulfonema limicola]
MEQIWKKVKTAIKEHMPGHSYRMWIEPMEFVENKGNSVVLSCPNFFSRKRVQDNYASLIEAQFSKTSGQDCFVTIEVSGKKVKKTKSKPEVRQFEPDLQLSIPEINSFQPKGQVLRKDYTFDRFVVGNNNDFAYSAALSLASHREQNQSSLFLLSDTGLGKSHLSQAIGHHILSHYPREHVYYITAEDFTNEMVLAFRNNAIDKFKEKYRRQCDVLLLEDVHFLAGKERTQMELGQALDYLLNDNKKIIFTSCYLPANIPQMNEQLKSRLSGGLISAIEAPDFKTRVKILQKKIKEKGYLIPKNITEYLAGELSENIRQLESGLLGVAAKASLLGVPIDLSLSESVVKNITRKTNTITVELIKQVVCSHYKISASDIVSKSRKKSIVMPRQLAIYLARKYTDQPLQVIGKSFNRYHTTVIHSIAVVEKGLRADKSLSKQLEYLCHKIEAGE